MHPPGLSWTSHSSKTPFLIGTYLGEGKEQLTPFYSLRTGPVPCQLLHQDPPALEGGDQLSGISVKSSLLPGYSLPASSSACRGGGPSLCFPPAGEDQKKMMDFLSVHPALGRKGAPSALSLELGRGLRFYFFNYICMFLADNTFRYLYICISSNCIFPPGSKKELAFALP